MAQKTIKSEIVVNAKTGDGFADVQSKIGQLSDKIGEIGEAVERYSSWARDFEKESLEVYKDYERNMLVARRVFNETAESQTDLDNTMRQLDDAAAEWAESSIFHTDDISATIASAAQAGWSAEKILAHMHDVMLLAEAGGLDLADGFTLLNGTMNALGTNDSAATVDMLVRASALANLTVEDLAESVARLGGLATMPKDAQELLAMLDILAGFEMRGADAGTAMKTMMLRLVAPTETTAVAMAALGLSAEEMEDLDTDGWDDAAAAINELGLQVYDADGNLRSFYDIFSDMTTLLATKTPEQQNAFLKTVFGTRGIVAAENLLKGFDLWGGMYDSITDSSGAAQRASDIVMDSLYGKAEILLSKWEELQRKTGETLEGRAGTIIEFLGSLLDIANNLPEEQFNALVDGLTAIGEAGPLLMILSGALALVSNPVIGIPALITAAVGASAYIISLIGNLDEMRTKANFGTLDINADDLIDQLGELKLPFDESREAVSEWAQAIDTANKRYDELNTQLSRELVSAALTGAKLSPEEISNLLGLGQQMTNTVLAGIALAQSRDVTFVDQLFGPDEELDEETLAIKNAWINAFSDQYTDLNDQAVAIGENIRKLIAQGLEGDNELSSEELDAIQAEVDRLHAIEAQIQNDYLEDKRYAQLAKASRLSLDSYEDYVKELGDLQKTAEEQTNTYWDTQMVPFVRMHENGEVSDEEYEAAVARLAAQRQAELETIQGKYGQTAIDAFDLMMQGSDYGDTWKTYMGLQRRYEAIMENLPKADEWGNYDFSGMSDEYLAYAATELNTIGQEMNTIAGQYGSMLRDADKVAKYNPYVNTWWSSRRTMPVNEIEGNGMASAITDWLNYKFYNAPDDQAATYIDGVNEYNEDNPAVIPIEESPDAKALGEQITKETQEGISSGVTIPVSADTSGLPDWMNTTLTGWSGNHTDPDGYAEGGRATTPSIFGEAGAEWAIPEEHSERTAQLLSAAANASGFTWGELMGLSSATRGSNDMSVSIVYSPTINGAGGDISATLQRDKEELRKVVAAELHQIDLRQRAMSF